MALMMDSILLFWNYLFMGSSILTWLVFSFFSSNGSCLYINVVQEASDCSMLIHRLVIYCLWIIFILITPIYCCIYDFPLDSLLLFFPSPFSSFNFMLDEMTYWENSYCSMLTENVYNIGAMRKGTLFVRSAIRYMPISWLILHGLAFMRLRNHFSH